MTTGERIEELAKERGLSLRKLAMLAGVPYNTIYSAVRRKSDRVDRKVIQKIAKALDVDVRSVISDEQFLQDYTENVLFKRFPEFDALDALLHVHIQTLNFDGRCCLLDYIKELAQKPEYQKDYTAPESGLPVDQTRVTLKLGKTDLALLQRFLDTDE